MMTLTSNEKRTVILGLLSVVAVCGYTYILKPLIAEAQDYTARIPQKQQELATVQSKAREYQSLQRQLPKQVHQDPNTDDIALLPKLQSLIKAHRLFAHLDQMKQDERDLEDTLSEIVVEATLVRIQLKQLIALLAVIDSPQFNADIQSLHITNTESQPGAMDVTIAVSQYNQS